MRKNRKLIYFGGNFEFQYKDFKPELMKDDYRAKILGDINKILYQPENTQKIRRLGKCTYYVGPYYFYENGLDGSNVVKTEIDMVNRCTHAVFLVDNTNMPGTVAEIIHASLIKKKIAIFYVKQLLDEGEPEKEICSANWYPLQFAKQIADAYLVECEDRDVAKMCIYNYVESLIQDKYGRIII